MFAAEASAAKIYIINTDINFINLFKKYVLMKIILNKFINKYFKLLYKTR
jgi:hypothetical protein